jgi:hypothetical protein
MALDYVVPKDQSGDIEIVINSASSETQSIETLPSPIRHRSLLNNIRVTDGSQTLFNNSLDYEKLFEPGLNPNMSVETINSLQNKYHQEFELAK